MTVWLAIPSKRPPAEANPTLLAWQRAGYRVALWCDDMADAEAKAGDLTLVGPYHGYAHAVNSLCKAILEEDSDAQWIVAAGDDTLPDPNHSAMEIGAQCALHFAGTFGVMQPTGDGHGIETICGSPWLGREWCERINQGNGPLWSEYHHNFVDNECQEVAQHLGVLWQRPDLTHRHNNWMWTTKVKPAFLERAYSQSEWDKSSALFASRKRAAFPGHEPLSVEVHA